MGCVCRQDSDVIGQASAYVVTYSMTDRSSYQWAYSFIDEVTQTRAGGDDARRTHHNAPSLSSRPALGTDVVVILVANKSDLVRKRQVSTEGESIDRASPLIRLYTCAEWRRQRVDWGGHVHPTL